MALDLTFVRACVLETGLDARRTRALSGGRYLERACRGTLEPSMAALRMFPTFEAPDRPVQDISLHSALASRSSPDFRLGVLLAPLRGTAALRQSADVQHLEGVKGGGSLEEDPGGGLKIHGCIFKSAHGRLAASPARVLFERASDPTTTSTPLKRPVETRSGASQTMNPLVREKYFMPGSSCETAFAGTPA